MTTLKEYLKFNPTETEEERHIAEFAAKIEVRLAEAEKLLRQVLPEWADEVKPSGMACCEISQRDVVMIRDFLANTLL